MQGYAASWWMLYVRCFGPPLTKYIHQYLSALRHIAVTVQREEEESTESHAMGEVVPYSLTRVICSLRYHTSNSAS